jgi:secondary thiamine-phosphate synthase enzyme
VKVETVAEGAVARQGLGRLRIRTRGQGFTEITGPVADWVAGLGIRHGHLTLFCRHTSASLTIQENADPDVRLDLLAALDRLAPRTASYAHGLEGPDDMPPGPHPMHTASRDPTICRRISAPW